MSAEDRGKTPASPFGPQPGTRVFTGGQPAPPSLRVRPAAETGVTKLRFEPEVASQSKALAELTARPSAPQSGLAFEPDEGDVLDGRSAARLPSEKVPRPKADSPRAEDAEIASLIELAAKSGRQKPAVSKRERTSLADPGRKDLSGDLLGPKKAPGETRGAAEERPPAPKAGEQARDPEAADEAAPSASRGWSSVLVSDAVVGKKRKRTTAELFRSSHLLPAIAERALQRYRRQVVKAIRDVDALLRRAGLALASVFAAAIIVAVALLIGVPLPWAGGIMAMCLVLTVAGQPARNLIGYAGIVIAAAAIAEIVRQRERFYEVFQMFL